MIWIKTNGFKASLVQKTHPTNAIAIPFRFVREVDPPPAIPYVFTNYSFPFSPLFLSPFPFPPFPFSFSSLPPSFQIFPKRLAV